MSNQIHNREDTPFPDAGADRIEGTFDEAKGRVKGAAGELTGDESLQGEGKLDQLTGKGKQGVADAKDTVNDAARKIKDGTG